MTLHREGHHRTKYRLQLFTLSTSTISPLIRTTFRPASLKQTPPGPPHRDRPPPARAPSPPHRAFKTDGLATRISPARGRRSCCTAHPRLPQRCCCLAFARHFRPLPTAHPTHFVASLPPPLPSIKPPLAPAPFTSTSAPLNLNPTSTHVRNEFTSFFKTKGHLHVPSSRCVAARAAPVCVGRQLLSCASHASGSTPSASSRFSVMFLL